MHPYTWFNIFINEVTWCTIRTNVDSVWATEYGVCVYDRGSSVNNSTWGYSFKIKIPTFLIKWLRNFEWKLRIQKRKNI